MSSQGFGAVARGAVGGFVAVWLLGCAGLAEQVFDEERITSMMIEQLESAGQFELPPGATDVSGNVQRFNSDFVITTRFRVETRAEVEAFATQLGCEVGSADPEAAATAPEIGVVDSIRCQVEEAEVARTLSAEAAGDAGWWVDVEARSVP